MDNIAKYETPLGVVIVAPGSRLDASNAAAFKKFFQAEAAAGSGRFVLDMAGLEFADSMGLGALVMALKTVTAAGGDIHMAALSPEVKCLIELTRLDKIFEIHETVDAAVASFS